jgi:hypothetical protein
VTRALALAGLVVLGACSGDESLTLTASPGSFAADGLTVVELAARVVFRGDAIDDGKTVIIRANDALLFESLEDVAPEEGESEVEVSTRGGVGRAYLLSPLAAADILVQASLTTVNRDVLADTVTIEAKSPPLVSAGIFNSDPGQMVVQFGVSCSQRNVGGVDNIGAFVPVRDDIRVPCTLEMRDFSGRALPNTPVRFVTEAGFIEDLPANEDDPRLVTYVVPPSPVILPREVDPVEAESTRNLVDFDGTGESVNPRDGLVTILAAVRGHEAFLDVNGNGRYDVGEPFQDEGEPFLDVDDDGEFTDIDVQCCDNDGDNHVDGPNGKFDSGVWIGRMTHILWSGPVDTERSGISPEGLNISAGASANLSLRIVDTNFNPVAAGEVDDEVEFTISSAPGGRVRFNPPDGVDAEFTPLPNHIGMELRKYPAFIFGLENASGKPVPVLVDLVVDDHTKLFRNWPVTLEDARIAGTSARCSTATWTFEVDVSYSPAPGESARQAHLTASGQLLAQPSPCP